MLPFLSSLLNFHFLLLHHPLFLSVIMCLSRSLPVIPPILFLLALLHLPHATAPSLSFSLSPMVCPCCPVHVLSLKRVEDWRKDKSPESSSYPPILSLTLQSVWPFFLLSLIRFVLRFLCPFRCSFCASLFLFPFFFPPSFLSHLFVALYLFKRNVRSNALLFSPLPFHSSFLFFFPTSLLFSFLVSFPQFIPSIFLFSFSFVSYLVSLFLSALTSNRRDSGFDSIFQWNYVLEVCSSCSRRFFVLRLYLFRFLFVPYQCLAHSFSLSSSLFCCFPTDLLLQKAQDETDQRGCQGRLSLAAVLGSLSLPFIKSQSFLLVRYANGCFYCKVQI